MNLVEFLASRMRQSGRYVPARLQAALALLERLRDLPSLKLSDHKRANSNGLKSHETYGDRAHNRLSLTVLNKTHGRRSCDVGGWGQELLDIIGQNGFSTASIETIDEAQRAFAAILRGIINEDPIVARIKGRSVETAIRDVLKQAEAKSKSGDVAQYLVGAKLMLRLNRDISVVQSNTRDRRSRTDREARTGDYEIEDATIEIAIGLPDSKHLRQIAEALEDKDLEVWLLTRHDRVRTWQNELKAFLGGDINRVVVVGVEAFIGQNMSEMGGFSSKGKAESLTKLFQLYNERWITAVGTPGIRIVIR